MPLPGGTRLGPYEILTAIGAGGMGEVYRARDTKLNRDVAIKVLLPAVADDPDRVARFTREAQVLASLNHPSIGAIYGFEDSGDRRALVMELVEGPTLADRIARGAIALDDALPIAKRIAEALEAAHEQNIIHRDLKPANVKVRTDGTVKVLDFGLAKALEPISSAGDSGALADSPTIASPVAMTQQGVLLGTAPYMAPEQAKGRAVDKRADIWAFGCVLYEMLTGRRAFAGDDVSDALASVIKSDPDWRLLPATTPAGVRRLLKRCLEKNPKLRLQAIGDARIEIDDALHGDAAAANASSSHAPRPGKVVLLLAASAALAIVATFAIARLGRDAVPRAPEVTRVLIGVASADQLRSNSPVENLTEGRPSRTAIALSPDGRSLVFSAVRGAAQQLWLRPLDRLEATPIAGTDDGDNPFFSPDGAWVAFWANGALKKVPLAGGAVTTICETAALMGASWGSNNTIAFAQIGGGLWQVSAAGGTPQPLTSLGGTTNEVSHRLPQILPGNEAVIFTVSQSTFPKWEETRVVVQSLATGERKELAQGSDARYLSTGHLVFMRGGALLAAPFDLTRLEVTGGVVTVISDVMQAAYLPNVANDSGAGQFSVSASGSLVYVRGSVFPDLERSLLWVDRAGATQPLAAPRRAYFTARLSPDGNRVLVWTSGKDRNVWIYDIARGTTTKLTTEGRNSYGLWTADGKRVIYRPELGRENLFWKAADATGMAERLTTNENTQTPGSVSSDGRTLLFTQNGPTTSGDIWSLSLDGDRQPRAIVHTPFNEGYPELSADGRWLAYTSNESGRQEVYVQPYPGPGPRQQVSVDGGSTPAWSRDGKELFYQARSPDTDVSVLRMMAVSVSTQPTFTAGVPRRLWQRPYPLTLLGYRGYDVAADGKRFLVVDAGERAPIKAAEMILIQNWTEELKRLVPSK